MALIVWLSSQQRVATTLVCAVVNIQFNRFEEIKKMNFYYQMKKDFAGLLFIFNASYNTLTKRILLNNGADRRKIAALAFIPGGHEA